MLSKKPGGAETFFEKLSLAFAAAGVPQCLVIEPNEEREALFRGLEGVEVVPIKFGGTRELIAKWKLRAVMARYRPEVMLTWMNRASRRVPAVDCPVIGRLGGYYKLKYYTGCDHLVGITPDLVEHIRGGDWTAESSTLIPNFGEAPHDLGETGAVRAELRAEFGVPEDGVALLALGRLHESKAHDTLLRAIATRPWAHLLLAGEGPLREDLEDLAAELELSERVRFLGWRRDIERLFAAADLSVFPSRYEPNGTVVMESWAHRIPLIAARSKGPEWLVDDGVNGLLFPIDDVAALGSCLDRLEADFGLRGALVDAGYRKFKEGFSRDAVVARYLELFQKLLSR